MSTVEPILLLTGQVDIIARNNTNLEDRVTALARIVGGIMGCTPQVPDTALAHSDMSIHYRLQHENERLVRSIAQIDELISRFYEQKP